MTRARDLADGKFDTDVEVENSSGATLKLTSTDTTGADTELLGQIDFVSSDSSTGSAGTQARIKGVYEDNGDSSGLEFFCGASTGSGTPTLFKRMTLSHDGENPAASIITDDNLVNLALISTDDDASGGPGLDLRRDSSSPADGDDIGYIRFRGDNSNGDEHTYGFFQAKALTVTDGSEDGGIELLMNKGGSNRSRMEVLAGETVFNEDSVDVDFRVESDVQMASFFVEGSTGNIGIGHNTPTLDSSVAGVSVSSDTKYVHIHDGDGAVLKLSDPSDGANRGGQIALFNTHMVINNCEADAISFGTGNTERMRLSTGALRIGQSSTDHPGSGNSTTGIGLRTNGDAFFSDADSDAIYGNRNNEGGVVSIALGGTAKGGISVSSSAVAFNTTSDRRLKSNIQDAASASDKIDALQVRQFNWNVDGSHQDFGLVAQELQPIAPTAVLGDADSDDMMSVDYSKLVPMLIKEIQELRGRVATLEAS